MQPDSEIDYLVTECTVDTILSWYFGMNKKKSTK